MMKKEKTRISVKKLILTAMFAAVMAVLSQICIPLPSGIPLTLQTFAAALCGYMLGARSGMTAVVVYILTGAAGMPVFSGMKGGVPILAGITGGFIWGLLPMAFMCGIGRRGGRVGTAVIGGAAGLLFCHVCGVLHCANISDTGFAAAFLASSAPYLFKDMIMLPGAVLISMRTERRLKSAGKRVM